MLVTSALIPPLAVWHCAARRLVRAPPGHAPLAPACPTWCSSTATARSCTTSRTTATRTLVAPVDGAPRGARPAARRRRAASAWSPTSPASPAGCSPLDQVGAGQRAGSRSCSGPFDTVQVCPHGPDDGCACRKPRAGHGARRRARSSASTRPAAWSSATSAPTWARATAAGRAGHPRADARSPAARRSPRSPDGRRDLGDGRRPASWPVRW